MSINNQTEVTRKMGAAGKHGRLHDPKELRPILARFLKRGNWLPNASFLINRSVMVGRRRWIIGLGVHVFGDIKAPPPHQVHFTASITILPPDNLSPSDEKRLAAMDYYERVSAMMSDLDYEGGWSKAGFGNYASFSKELATRRELWVEVRRLEEFDVSFFRTGMVRR